MADYLWIATINIVVAFEVMLLGCLNMDFLTNQEGVEALIIIAFLLLLASTILVVLMKMGDLAGNMIALCFTLAMAIAAGKITSLLVLVRKFVVFCINTPVCTSTFSSVDLIHDYDACNGGSHSSKGVAGGGISH